VNKSYAISIGGNKRSIIEYLGVATMLNC